MTDLKVSVVTVCLNAAKTIGHTIESFCSQDHPHKEMLILDGGSKDETAMIVGSMRRPDVTFVSEPDGGLYDAMNKGLGRYSGDAVGFLNADDRFKNPTVLTQIADVLTGADIVFGNLNFVRSHEHASVVRRWRGSDFQRNAFAEGWMPAHPTFYAKRNVVDAVGRFDLTYKVAADYDFMLRALELHQFRAVFVDRILVDMSYGGVSTSGVRAYLKSNFEARRSRRAWLNAPLLDRAIIAKPLRKVRQFWS